jgi:hypothetical protein
MFQFTHSRDGGDDFRFGLGDLRRRRRRLGGRFGACSRWELVDVEGLWSVSVSVSVSVSYTVNLWSLVQLGSMLAGMEGLQISCYHEQWQERLCVSER